MHSIINSGGVVVSCELKEGQFIYSSSSNISYIKRYVGSKYTKSNPLDAYRLVDDYLKKGKEVLFIGLPCHVAGIKKFIGAKKSENLYLVDLICHGTPSQKLLKMFLDDNGVDIENIKELYFRKKDSFSVSLKEGEIVPVSVIDRYTMGFLSGLFYTDNCYDCKYASVDRVSDLTLGDSWGTDLKDEASKGISLVLCNSFKGKKLLEKSELVLFDVDCKMAVKHNGQLDHPSEIRSERNKFFKLLYKWNSFSKAVFYVYPKYCIKQKIKAFLIKKRH
jgi:coenzyme F420-reducing hydrogenase beta subunit